MKGQSISLRTILTLCALALAAMISSIAYAQSQQAPAPQYMVTTINVKSEMMGEFQKFWMSEVKPALKKAGLTEFQVWAPTMFSEGNEFLFATPITSMAAFDNPHPLVRAMGEAGAQLMMAKIARFTTGPGHSFMIRGQPELSVLPKAGYKPKLALLVREVVIPARRAEFEKTSRDMVTVMKKINAKGMLTGRVGIGGNPNEYYRLLMADSFADLEKFLQTATKAMSDANAGPPVDVSHVGLDVKRYLPDASIEPDDN